MACFFRPIEGLSTGASGMQRFLINTILIGVIALALTACGTGSEETSGSAVDQVPAAGVPWEEGPAVVRAGDTFTVDSFVNAGFKKSKEFSPETVPEATSIWYGFYSRRDIEIRFYDSHEQAAGPGVTTAQAAVDRSPNTNRDGAALFASGQRTSYDDFMVAGNTVILCQTDISACVELVDNIP